MIKQSRKLPGELYQSLTWDRGSELASHKRLALAADVAVMAAARGFIGAGQPAGSFLEGGV